MNYELFASTQPAGPGPLSLYLIDIDGTMITSKSGKRWAADAEDWSWLGDVTGTLRKLAGEGWTVALVSNQSDWKVSSGPKAKIVAILDALEGAIGWKPWTLVATATRKEKDTVYRKPARGLYDVLLTALGITPTKVRMCGDAVGSTDPFPPYRWADSDAAFATAIGAEFVRPCELFDPCDPPRALKIQELVILMGNPGSGKSSTGRLLASAGYVHVEQDVVGTKAAVKKAVLAALNAGASVVVDATHGSATNREPYLTLAAERGLFARILWHIRDGRPFNALREKPVPEVAYAVYSKHFTVPEIAEIVY